jgi:4-hydroxy-3-methylbut-2-enyl diphosphate reductase
VVVGEADHPEIVGILGCTSRGFAVSGWEELAETLAKNPELYAQPLTFVSQTTAIEAGWKKTVENAKKVCTNAEFFDTICGATSRRQSEALELAAQCDAMIVIGDQKSSNTRRLIQLCARRCPMVVQAERGRDIDMGRFQSVGTLGITAGASTPGWIIKEVSNKMSDEIMEIEQSFAEMLEESFKILNTGDRVTGTVAAITPTEIQVELGVKYPGSIPLSELSDDPDVKVEDIAKVGDEIEAVVRLVSDRDCVVVLSKKRLDADKNWEIVENAVESKDVLEGIITEENKGGLVASVKGIRVFIPASQSGKPRGADLSEMVKTRVKLRVTEVNRARRRVVGSIRAVAAEARAAAAAEIWNNIEVGKHYSGTVKSLTSYGAFVDIGGVDGMVHISELSWSRIKTPAEVVSVGDPVEVYVISFDPEKKKISLGMKDHSQEPWTVFTTKYAVGDTAAVRVVKLMTFGAFAEIVPGVDGLIHISQIADHRVEKPGDVLAEGDVVDAKIIAIDEENKKVSLSIRALLEEGPVADEAEDESEAE